MKKRNQPAEKSKRRYTLKELIAKCDPNAPKFTSEWDNLKPVGNERIYPEDFEDETAYLLSRSNNAKRLNRSIEEIEAGLGTEHSLIEPDDKTSKL